MKPHIDIVDVNREAVINILNYLLADEFILYTKTLNYHWNVQSPQFHDLHKFFEEQYITLGKIIDDVAERVRALGGRSFGTINEFAQSTRLKEQPGFVPHAHAMIESLLADQEAIIRELRKDLDDSIKHYQDAGTNNFLTDIMQKHEKMAWMLRACLVKN